MKIQRFALIAVIAFFVLIAVLSSSFYHIERVGTLRYISEGINQNMFRLEEDIQVSLQQNQMEELQTLLDEASAIDGAIENISLSLDGKSVVASSSRSLSGKLIEGKYLPLEQLSKGLIEEKYLHYSSEVSYFTDASKKRAILLIDLDETFVFERLNHIALFYGLALFLFLGILDKNGYQVILIPRTDNFYYEFEQLSNLGFAITPKTRFSLHLTINKLNFRT